RRPRGAAVPRPNRDGAGEAVRAVHDAAGSSARVPAGRSLERLPFRYSLPSFVLRSWCLVRSWSFVPGPRVSAHQALRTRNGRRTKDKGPRTVGYTDLKTAVAWSSCGHNVTSPTRISSEALTRTSPADRRTAGGQGRIL